jgi:isopentenyl diphosphate isomerase/L-lactate dehydrogenase-like FMN-dependent dehydrogenase
MSVETPSRTRFATLDEIAAAARDALDPAVWDFMDGGAGTERTLRANCAAFSRWSFRPGC